MSATTKMIFAMPAAAVAIPKNPNTAAIRAMMKNAMAQPNMVFSFAIAHRDSSGHATWRRAVTIARFGFAEPRSAAEWRRAVTIARFGFAEPRSAAEWRRAVTIATFTIER
jgi:hypothetical protein